MAGSGGPGLGVRTLPPTLLCTVFPGEHRDLLLFRQTVGRGANEVWKFKGSSMMTKEVIGDCFPSFREFIIHDYENCRPGYVTTTMLITMIESCPPGQVLMPPGS